MNAFLTRLDNFLVRVSLLFIGSIAVIAVGVNSDGTVLGFVKSVAGVALTLVVLGAVSFVIAWIVKLLFR